MFAVFDFASLRRLAPLLSIVWLAGCSAAESGKTSGGGGDGGSGGVGPGGGAGAAGGATGETCAELAPTCKDSQLGCVVSSGSARCAPCDDGAYAPGGGACELIPGTPIEHDFPQQVDKSGEEQIGNCRSWTLHNDAPIWVNAVELAQDEGSHHSNWTYGPDDKFDGPDGIWPCADRSYEFYAGVAAGGVVYNQSTQASHEVQKFPAGAAVEIPAHARIISDIHLLNTGPTTITGRAKLTLYTLPHAQVTTELKSFHVEYDALEIPPHSTARFTGHCSIADAYLAATGEVYAPKIYYLLPHTHTLSTRFFVNVLGGPNDGESLLDLGAYDSGARGRTFDPPVDMNGSSGLLFACQYLNPRADTVGWGFGSQEMCELFGFSDASAFVQARVETGKSDGQHGGVERFSGDCVVEQPTQ